MYRTSGCDKLACRDFSTKVFLGFAVAISLCTPAAAEPDESFRFEITPYAAYRMGGSFDEQDGAGRVDLNDSSAEGILFNIEANLNGQYQLLYARQRTDADTLGFLVNDPTIDMDIEHIHFGGTYLFGGDNMRPFIALTLGVSQFDPELPGTDSESFFSASFGGGVQLNASKRLGVRLEALAFTTFVDDDSNIFCSSIDGAGTCLIRVDARTLTQWEARAGLVFRF
ncbi:MAG: porin family protein [Gammaproteobacteria bacterium]|nr:porin family protein [Gammaproteobacteria bacterium]